LPTRIANSVRATANPTATNQHSCWSGWKYPSGKSTPDHARRVPATQYVSGFNRMTAWSATCDQGDSPVQAGIGKNAPESSHMGMSNKFMTA
jgi:hypothetical protein